LPSLPCSQIWLPPRPLELCETDPLELWKLAESLDELAE
jgi:hypothetical protein